MRTLCLAGLVSGQTVINTWPFTEANDAAWGILKNGGSALDAITTGTSKCESLRCDGSVGWGGSPDENGETTLDAMIMDGETYNAGAVSAIRRVKDAAKVARAVMDHTSHTMMAGDLASRFAYEMGFKNESLTSKESTEIYQKWKNNDCQPNFWINVSPDASKNCGPYTPNDTPSKESKFLPRPSQWVSENNHDTIGMVAIDNKSRKAAGTTTNGLTHKIAGRVGDSPVPGAGAYSGDGGGSAATGDGDVMMRFLPTYQAVENMRLGKSPRLASLDAMRRIVSKLPDFVGAVIAMNTDGEHGAACHRLNQFPYCHRNSSMSSVEVIKIDCSTNLAELDKLIDMETNSASYFENEVQLKPENEDSNEK